MEPISDLNIPEKILEIAERIREAGGRAFLVGGFVRDALLGNTESRDFDIEVYDLDQETLLQILKSFGRTDIVGKAFGVFHLSMKGLSLDFSFPRTESKIGYGHRGFLVKTNPKLSFKEAAYRRDFTINAMGMELPDLALCDPYGGVQDLKNQVLRHVGPAFSEDSLRILRGVQFASRFKFILAEETIALCRTLSLSDLSIERLFEEFKKWLLKPGKPSFGLKAFLEIELQKFFPEILSLNGSFDLLGKMLDNMFDVRENIFCSTETTASLSLTEEEKMELAFSVLLFGQVLIKKEQQSFQNIQAMKNQVLQFLGKMTNEIHLLKKVPEILSVCCELDFKTVPSAPQMRRYAVRLGGLSLLVMLIYSLPSELLKSSEYQVKFFQEAKNLNLLEKAPKPFLTGKMLLELGVTPGKEMGILIQESFDLQLDGLISSSEEAISFAKKRISTSI